MKPEDLKDLQKARDSWEKLENNLKIVQSLPWQNFENIDSAKIPQALDLVHALHRDEFEYAFLQSARAKKRIKRPSLHLNNGITTVSIFYGALNIKTTEDKDGDTIEEIVTKPNKTIPRFIYPILDYLHGTTVFHGGNLYLINKPKFELLSELKINERYKLAKSSSFKAGEIIEVLKFIDEHLNLAPIKAIKTATIACKDFQIDLHSRKIMLDTPPNPNESYFKVFDCDYRAVMDLQERYVELLDMVTDDKDSLHNAALQPVYTMLVACREVSKARFFVSKSSTRTGKGLRHKVLTSIFDTKNIELDNLTAGGFEGLNAWAQLDGGEFLLATEQGELTGKAIERVLKIIATEDSHSARQTGGNSGLINLSGVLSIDSNEKVLFSKDMNSRAVNIAFKNRPDGETDKEREKVFSPYWTSFTIQTATSTSKQATETAGIASLVHSFLYWQSEDFQFNFKIVEMDNFINDFEFDDVQSYLLEKQRQGVKTFPLADKELSELTKETYTGFSRKTRRDKALEEIGMKRKVKPIYKTNEQTGQEHLTSVKVIEVNNSDRNQKAMTRYLESFYD